MVELAYRTALSDLRQQSKDLEFTQREQYLRRALDAIHRFEVLDRDQRGTINNTGQKIHEGVIEDLLTCSEGSQDSIDAFELRHELYMLRRQKPEDGESISSSTLYIEQQNVIESARVELDDLGVPAALQARLSLCQLGLHHAVEKSLITAVKSAYQYDIQALANKDIMGRTIVHVMVCNNELTLLKDVIERMPPLLEVRDCFHRTPLLLSAMIGNTIAFDSLLQLGADPRCRDLTMRSVLNYLCQSGNIPQVKAVLDKDVLVNDNSISGRTPLYDAAANNRYTICRMLLDAGGQVEPAAREVARTKEFTDIVSLLDTDQQQYDRACSATMSSCFGSRRSTPGRKMDDMLCGLTNSFVQSPDMISQHSQSSPNSIVLNSSPCASLAGSGLVLEV